MHSTAHHAVVCTQHSAPCLATVVRSWVMEFLRHSHTLPHACSAVPCSAVLQCLLCPAVLSQCAVQCCLTVPCSADAVLCCAVALCCSTPKAAALCTVLSRRWSATDTVHTHTHTHTSLVKRHLCTVHLCMWQHCAQGKLHAKAVCSCTWFASHTKDHRLLTSLLL